MAEESKRNNTKNTSASKTKVTKKTLTKEERQKKTQFEFLKEEVLYKWKHNGFLSHLRAQIRSKLVLELQTKRKINNQNITSNVVPTLEYRLLNSIIINFLKRKSYTYSLSVFVSEIGGASISSLPLNDALFLLKIINSKNNEDTNKFYKNELSILEFLVQNVRDTTAKHVNDKNKTIKSIELETSSIRLKHKLEEIDKMYDKITSPNNNIISPNNTNIHNSNFTLHNLELWKQKLEFETQKKIENEIKKFKEQQCTNLNNSNNFNTITANDTRLSDETFKELLKLKDEEITSLKNLLNDKQNELNSNKIDCQNIQVELLKEQQINHKMRNNKEREVNALKGKFRDKIKELTSQLMLYLEKEEEFQSIIDEKDVKLEALEAENNYLKKLVSVMRLERDNQATTVNNNVSKKTAIILDHKNTISNEEKINYNKENIDRNVAVRLHSQAILENQTRELIKQTETFLDSVTFDKAKKRHMKDERLTDDIIPIKTSHTKNNEYSVKPIIEVIHSDTYESTVETLECISQNCNSIPINEDAKKTVEKLNTVTKNEASAFSSSSTSSQNENQKEKEKVKKKNIEKLQIDNVEEQLERKSVTVENKLLTSETILAKKTNPVHTNENITADEMIAEMNNETMNIECKTNSNVAASHNHGVNKDEFVEKSSESVVDNTATNTETTDNNDKRKKINPIMVNTTTKNKDVDKECTNKTTQNTKFTNSNKKACKDETSVSSNKSSSQATEEHKEDKIQTNTGVDNADDISFGSIISSIDSTENLKNKEANPQRETNTSKDNISGKTDNNSESLLDYLGSEILENYQKRIETTFDRVQKMTQQDIL